MYLISVYFDEKTNNILQKYIDKVALETGNLFMEDKHVPPHMTISSIEARNVEVLIPAVGSIPDDDIKRMIAESYDLVTDSPSKRIYEAVKKIPKGKVATYGQVAELAGEFAFGGAGAQAKLLRADGIEVTDGKVDLKKYGNFIVMFHLPLLSF